MPSTARRIRELLDGKCITVPGCYDPLSALMIERSGFPAAYLSAWSVHVAQLGIPHLGVASLKEYVELAGRITAAIDIPLVVDIEHGLGGPLEVRRAVSELERVGVAAVSINDQTRGMGWMIRSDDVQTGFVSVDRMRAKIGAAATSRADPDFMVIGRTDATRISLDEGVSRCNAWLEAGADVGMPMLSPWLGFRGNTAPHEELRTVIGKFVNRVNGPVAIHNAYGLDIGRDEAAGLDLSMYIIPQATLGYAATATWNALTALRDGTLNSFADAVPPFTNDQFGKIVDFESHGKFAQRFGV